MTLRSPRARQKVEEVTASITNDVISIFSVVLYIAATLRDKYTPCIILIVIPTHHKTTTT